MGTYVVAVWFQKFLETQMDPKKGFLDYYELTIPTKVRTVAKQFSQTFLGQNEPFWGKKRLKNSYFESYLWISTCCVGPNAVAVWL